MFSFVIPTLATRRPDVERCLAGLARETDGLPSEALLVAEDEAAGGGFERFATASLSIRVVLQGGGAAKRRNAAFRVLRGDVVALLDDDAEPLPGYGRALAARFAPGAPGQVVQGAVWPAFDCEPPASLGPVLFSVGGFNCLGDARRKDVFISANCAVSRQVLDRIGGMREDLGPGSGGVAWGDDTDWVARARAAGFPLVHDEAIAARHRIQAERLTERYVLDRAERVGRTRARLEWETRRPGFTDVAKARALAVWARTKGAGIEARCRALRLAGYAAELATIRAG